MALTVVGSIAFDRVKTPFGERERMLGGAATHFALAASFFDDVRVVGPVGDDFGDAEYEVLRTRGTNTDDVEHVEGGKTFFWHGEYHFDLNSRTTHDTQLNVFETFEPKLSQESRDADVLFLANIQPDLQRQVREQCERARFVAMDSMNLWIDIARDSLVKTIESVDALLLNDAELKQLTGEPGLLKAARAVMEMGPKVVVAKQGEYGAALFTEDGFFGLPAYPARDRRRPDRRGRLVRRRLHGLPRRATARAASTTRCCAARWPTARRSPPTTSRSSGPSACSASPPDEVKARVADLSRITHFADAPDRASGVAAVPERGTLPLVGGEVWGFLWVMLALKIPLALLLYIVWYAVHATPEPTPGDDGDGGVGPRPRRAAPPRPAPPRPARRPGDPGAAAHAHGRRRARARAAGPVASRAMNLTTLIAAATEGENHGHSETLFFVAGHRARRCSPSSSRSSASASPTCRRAPTARSSGSASVLAVVAMAAMVVIST